MMALLNVSSNDVQIVGICGIGGIGKTTIAKVIYNKLIQNFDCCSFLENVRESAKQHNGLVSLQKQLLTETLNLRPDIADVNSGIDMIKRRFLRKKVLLVLDDVTERSQLDCLVGNCIWFGPGSRIIVTTRDKHVLGALEVNGIYEPPFMDSEQALQLFSMHAFRSKFPPEAYDSISREIVSTAAGLPLALEVIGSFLSDKDLKSWKETLIELEKIPDDQVSKKWMISYQALNDAQKQIFLDIACLFIGMDKSYAFYMWNDCGYDTKTEINVLCLMSLVKIGDDNVLWMQNELRVLGMEIVRKEDFLDPGKRSRLWDHEEALVILKQRGGTEMVEALSLDFELGSQPRFTNKEFVKLIKLRYLQMYGAELVGDFKDLLPNLRWLNWRGCPSIFKPANFHLKNLVILDLSYSDVTEDWGGWSQIKTAKNLKVLKLAYCSIRRTPDLSTHALLEILILRGCACLNEIGRSIGNMKKLKVLDISETRVRKLPDEVRMLEKLEINATDCFYLKRDIPSCIGGQSSERLAFQFKGQTNEDEDILEESENDEGGTKTIKLPSKVEGVAESGDVSNDGLSSSDGEDEEEEIEEEEVEILEGGEDALYKAKGKERRSQDLLTVKKEFKPQFFSSDDEDFSGGKESASKNLPITQHSSKALKKRSPSEKTTGRVERKIISDLEKTEDFNLPQDSPKLKKKKVSTEIVLGPSMGHNLLNIHLDQQVVQGEDIALQASIMESLASQGGNSLPFPAPTIGISIPSGPIGTSTGPAPSILEATRSLTTSAPFMMKRRALPALEDLYKMIKATKSSSTSTSSASVLMLPGPSDETIMPAKEQLLSYLSQDVEKVVYFHQNLASTLNTLKKHSGFTESIKISLNKLQHQLQFIVSNVDSSSSSIAECERKVKLRDKAFEDFQLALEPYPEIREQAEKLANQKEVLTVELNRIQKELEQIEHEEFELDKTASAILTESEPFKKDWESLVNELPQLEDAKARAVDSLEESRRLWMEFGGKLASI
ncbi:disease resistance protein TAO1-like [Cornus florida]|uniref:disease resistance protein TAO1-like n=1 Tax=Cornus florida TaxID=4283 RepID=UPI00289DC5E0|nr:disease resistance protein TAO1-like [Cornus florida]